MTREIKFRAWDEVQNKMIYDGDYWLPLFTLKRYFITANPKTCSPIKVTNHGVVYCRSLDNSCVWVEVHDDTDKPKSRSYYSEWEYDAWDSSLPIMQYTGLKDKNGKERYQGDIEKEDGGIYEIVWLESWAGFFRKIIKPSDYEPAAFGEFTPLTSKQKPEIIGDIYQNPELLTKEVSK